MDTRILSDREKQVIIWDYYKPRHTHTWNMLVLSWRDLEKHDDGDNRVAFEAEYLWENFILRLWLYRTTIKTLTKLSCVENEAQDILKMFDRTFDTNGKNGLKALRDMIEHFDEYAEGKGHGPAVRARDLDPWREVTRDRLERGAFFLDRQQTYNAAIKLRADAKQVSDKFIQWYKSTA